MRYTLYDYSTKNPSSIQDSDLEEQGEDTSAIIMKFAEPEYQTSLLILDRDDTLLVDSGYMSGNDELSVNLKLTKILQQIDSSKVSIAIATNQSGIGRGLFGLEECLQFNLRMHKYFLEEFSLEISLIAICPHSPIQDCICRKPKPKLLELCMTLTRTPAPSTIFVGNSSSDFESGALAFVNTYNAHDNLHLQSVSTWIENNNVHN